MRHEPSQSCVFYDVLCKLYEVQVLYICNIVQVQVKFLSSQKVEQMAEHSLESKEVLTETMAEVWEKQGNKPKAIDIYSKLSLLEPLKSAYFAAKIEDLKKTN